MSSGFKRRDFLRTLGQSSVVAASVGLLGPGEVLAARKPRVVVVHGTDPLRMLKSALRVFRRVTAKAKGKRLVIKPNMSFNNPAAWGNNTSPEVAAAVAQLCKEWGASHIAAVDHPLSGGPRAMRTCGVEPALQKVGGIEVICAHRRPLYQKKTISGGKALKSIDIPKELARADMLINVPVAKQHAATKVSAGLKNLMGLIWDRRVFHHGMDLHQGVAELAKAITPQLTIIDATRVMVTNGPQGPGQVQKLHAIVVSDDPVAADAVAISLTQWKRQRLDPKDVEHVKRAAGLGLGVADLSGIKIIKKRV